MGGGRIGENQIRNGKENKVALLAKKLWKHIQSIQKESSTLEENEAIWTS